MDVVASCQEKLSHFRIKELKDVLSSVGVSKQGRKQDLVDRIIGLLCDDGTPGLLNKVVNGNEELVQIIGDVYRKMQKVLEDGSDKKQNSHGISRVLDKDNAQDNNHPMKIQCPCASALPTDPLIQCEDPDCKVWQHVSCVFIPDKPMENLPSASQFFCELCRLKRADPFWETLGHPVYPAKLETSKVPDDRDPLQRMEKTFQLTKAEGNLLKKAAYDLQAWCILLNDNVPFRMQWPKFADLQVNGIPVRTLNRPDSQLLGANGRDDGARISILISEGVNKISLSGCDARIFCFGVRLAKRRTLQQVLSMVPKEAEGEKLESALARVQHCINGGITTSKEGDDSGNDVEVIADAVTVNLRCPMSGSRIRTAGRFKPCAHMGCFDLETFVKLNERSRKWQCPICLKNYSLGDLIVDAYFNRIAAMMQKCGEEMTEIDVKPDCFWRVKKAEFMDLAMWHNPDGTEVMSSSVSSKLDDQEEKSRELISKPGTRGSVAQSHDRHLFYNNSLYENMGEEVIAMSSSSTVDEQHDGVPSVNQNCDERYGVCGNNENEVDSVVHNNCGLTHSRAGPCCGVQDVIILSDSEEEEEEPSLAYPESVTEAIQCHDATFSSAPQTGDGCSALDMPMISTVSNGGRDDFSVLELQHAADSVAAVDLEHMSITCSGPVSGCLFSSKVNVNPGSRVLNSSVFHNYDGSDNELRGNHLGSVNENLPMQRLPLAAQSCLTKQLLIGGSGDVENQTSLRPEMSEADRRSNNIKACTSAFASGVHSRQRVGLSTDSSFPKSNGESLPTLKGGLALISVPRRPRSATTGKRFKVERGS